MPLRCFTPAASCAAADFTLPMPPAPRLMPPIFAITPPLLTPMLLRH